MTQITLNQETLNKHASQIEQLVERWHSRSTGRDDVPQEVLELLFDFKVIHTRYLNFLRDRQSWVSRDNPEYNMIENEINRMEKLFRHNVAREKDTFDLMMLECPELDCRALIKTLFKEDNPVHVNYGKIWRESI